MLLWFAGASWVLLATIPETFSAIVLRSKARRLRKETGNEDLHAPIERSNRSIVVIFKTAMTRPWQLLFDPISFFVAIYYSLVYTLLYMLFEIYPIVFQQKRGWNAGVGELPLLGTVIGACLGGVGLYYLGVLQRKREAEEHEKMPEDNLPGAMIGGILFPISVFWFSWSGEYDSIHWAVPSVAGVFLAVSILLIFVVFFNYIVDTYVTFAASALAANTILRSACAASAPLFTNYMFNGLGVGPAGSIVGGVGALLMPLPFILYKYGAAIRARSKYTSTD